MTAILVLLCLAIAGRELYLAFERKHAGSAPEIDDIRSQLAALKDTRDDLARLRADVERLTDGQTAHDQALRDTDARIRSLITQINDRMLPEVTARLTEQRQDVDRLSSELAHLRGHLVRQLDRAVAASLGADPVDTVAGTLTTPRPELTTAYEQFAQRLGLRVELATPLNGGTRYYLSGRSARALERDFFDLLHTLRTNPPLPVATAVGTLARDSSGPHGKAQTPTDDATAANEDARPRPHLQPGSTSDDAGPATAAASQHGRHGQVHAATDGDVVSGVASGEDARSERRGRVDESRGSMVEAARNLLACMGSLESGGAQLGPLVVVRTRDSLMCGVLALAELRDGEVVEKLHDPVAAAARLRELPQGRFCRLQDA